jgi:hypothetical protein
MVMAEQALSLLAFFRCALLLSTAAQSWNAQACDVIILMRGTSRNLRNAVAAGCNGDLSWFRGASQLSLLDIRHSTWLLPDAASLRLCYWRPVGQAGLSKQARSNFKTGISDLRTLLAEPGTLRELWLPLRVLGPEELLACERFLELTPGTTLEVRLRLEVTRLPPGYANLGMLAAPSVRCLILRGAAGLKRVGM